MKANELSMRDINQADLAAGLTADLQARREKVQGRSAPRVENERLHVSALRLQRHLPRVYTIKRGRFADWVNYCGRTKAKTSHAPAF